MVVKKSVIPFIALLLISAWWSFYYLSQHAINDFGAAKSEWYLLIDGLIVLPALCWFCIADKQQALLKAAAYCALMILLGAWILPPQEQIIWQYLSQGRYGLLALLVLVEVVTIFTVIVAVKGALTQRSDPDLAMSTPIQRHFGHGLVSQLLCIETRVWSYALFARQINAAQFTGSMHFSYHHKDGTQSNLLGFMMMIAFELPLTHVLLHFLWTPTAANIVSLLTIMSLIFFIGEYRACSRRPISLTHKELIIRYGIWSPQTIALEHIADITFNQQRIKRASHVKRYNLFGVPNVHIKLTQPINGVSDIYLGVDQPQQLIETINLRIALKN